MSISSKHSLRSKVDRKTPGNNRPRKDEVAFNTTDQTVEKIYCDIANGVSRSVCMQKLVLGEYGNRKIGARQAQNYYNAALDRFAVDTDIESEKLRNLFYGRYEALLEEAIKKGDIFNAKGILDSMSRIFGVEKKVPQNAIQINGGDEKITINFGFAGGNDGEEGEAED